MAIDLYETRTMLEALEQMLPAKTFLRNTFFSTVEVSTTEHVDIDIMKGKRLLAPFVSPKKEGKLVERIGFSTRTYKPPYVKPKMVTTAHDFLKRDVGQHVYGANDTAYTRAQKMLGRDLRSLEDEIARREEWMAASLLQTGQVNVKGDGVDDVIDFDMDAENLITLSGTDLWSDQTNSKPLENLRTWCRQANQKSGLRPTDMVMGSSALDAFLDHPDVQSQLDTRRIDLGLIDPQPMDGVIYYGRIKDVALDLWQYDEWYIDEDTGVEESMIDPKKVILANRNARTARHYGAIQDLEFAPNGLVSVPRFPKSWIKKDPSVQYLMVQSAPLLALHQVDAFICAQVLA